MTKTRVQNERNEPTFYARIPKMVIMDLNPYELALYCNYKQTASDDGYCDKSNTKLAKETHMSVGKVKQAKKSLEDKKLITVQHRRDKSGIENQTTYIKIVDIWQENHLRYAVEGSHHMTTPSHTVTTGGAPDNQGVVTKRPQRRTTQEEPKKNNTPRKESEEVLFRREWATYADYGCALLKVFGIDCVFQRPDETPRAALLNYLDTAKQLKPAGATLEEIPALHRYVANRAKRENWTSFGVKTLAKYFMEYRASVKKAIPVSPENDLNKLVEFEPILLARSNRAVNS